MSCLNLSVLKLTENRLNMEASCFPNTENRTFWFNILKILCTVFFEVDPNVIKFPPIISVPFDSVYLTFLLSVLLLEFFHFLDF